MTSWFRRRRLLVFLAAGITLLFASCAPPAPPPPPLPDAPTRARLLQDARQALATLGEHRFEVMSLEPLGEPRSLDMVDPLDFHSRYALLGFQARVRVTSLLHVPRVDEQAEACAQPGWSIDRAFADLQLSALEREGDYPPGSERVWRGAAMCLDLEPGWRFDQFDRLDRTAMVVTP